MATKPSRERLIAERLLEGAPLAEIAAELGISTRQLRRLRARPRVVQLVSTGQREALRESRARLAGVTGSALDTIAAVLADQSVPAAVRVSTALRALELAHALAGMADLAERLSSLECAWEGRG